MLCWLIRYSRVPSNPVPSLRQNLHHCLPRHATKVSSFFYFSADTIILLHLKLLARATYLWRDCTLPPSS